MEALTNLRLLVGVQTRIWNRLEKKLQYELNVGLATIEFLHTISMNKNIRLNELARTMDLTVGGTSKIVDRMVRGGLVQRGMHPDDRRSLALTPSSAGTVLLAQGREIVEKQLFPILDDPEIIRALKSIRARLDAVETSERSVAIANS